MCYNTVTIIHQEDFFMIIRMTVEDNDYTEMLEKFADNLFERLYIESSLVLNEFYTPEVLHELIEIEETIRKTMWAESMDGITDEAKTLLKVKLHIIWGKYVDSIEKEDRIKAYLKRDFDCSFSFTFEDKWENGEVVYYFTTAKKWISQ